MAKGTGEEMNIRTRREIRERAMIGLEHRDPKIIIEEIKNIIVSQGETIEESKLANIIQNYTEEREEKEAFGADGKQMYWVKTGIVDQLLLATDGGEK